MRINRRRAAAAAAGGLALVTALAACSAGDDPAGETESDNQVVLYSGRAESLVQPLIDQFEAETGISVDVRYDGTTALAALLLEEGDQTPADVYLSQDAGALGAVSNAGLFAELPSDIADAVPAGFTSTDASWVGVTGRARVIVYDGQELTEDDVPDSVLPLTEPEWRGRVAIAPTNASFQAFVTAFRVIEGEEAARAWLEGLVANDVQKFEGNGAILDAVNTGQVDVGLINHYYWFQTASEVGQDAMRAQQRFLTPPDPGALVNVTGAGLLAGAAGDADALELIRYLVSAEGQQYFVEETYEYPLVPGIDPPAGLPALEDLRNPDLDLSDLDSLSETVELIAEVGLT